MAVSRELEAFKKNCEDLSDENKIFKDKLNNGVAGLKNELFSTNEEKERWRKQYNRAVKEQQDLEAKLKTKENQLLELEQNNEIQKKRMNDHNNKLQMELINLQKIQPIV